MDLVHLLIQSSFELSAISSYITSVPHEAKLFIFFLGPASRIRPAGSHVCSRGLLWIHEASLGYHQLCGVLLLCRRPLLSHVEETQPGSHSGRIQWHLPEGQCLRIIPLPQWLFHYHYSTSIVTDPGHLGRKTQYVTVIRYMHIIRIQSWEFHKKNNMSPVNTSDENI